MNRMGSLIFTGAAILLAVCGASTALAGIEGSGKSVVAFGSITGFGSVFVNGVEYSTSGAQILIDGQPATQAQLNTGQAVTVLGTVNDDGTTGTATQVSFTSNVRGAITQLGVGGFAVLGQTVLTTGSTIFGAGTLPLRVGTPVEVSGFPDASGNIVASSVYLATTSGFQVVGVVQGLDTNAHTFRINGLTVDYTGAQNVPTLANGSTVEVHGANLTANGTLVATDLALVPAIAGTAGEVGDLEGVVTSVLDLLDFIVDGQHVTIDLTTVVLGGLSLVPGVVVDVKGVYDASGTLHATTIQILLGGTSLLLIDSVTPANDALCVLGVAVQTFGSTTLDERSSQPVRWFRLADLPVVDHGEVSGTASQGSDALRPLEPYWPADAGGVREGAVREAGV